MSGAARECPDWCTFDHGGDVYANEGDHVRFLSPFVEDFVQVQSTAEQPDPVISLWLCGNPTIELPFDQSGVRILADIIEALSTALGALRGMEVPA